MRDYQAKKSNPYILPKPLYMQVLWLIRDYDRMNAEYHNIIDGRPGPPDGQPRGNGLGNSTEQKALKRADLWVKIEAIEQALNTIPEEYRKGIWNNIVYWYPYPIDAAQRTYARYKQRFIYRIAEKLHWI